MLAAVHAEDTAGIRALAAAGAALEAKFPPFGYTAILVAGAEALQPPGAIADAVARKLQGLW